MLRSAAGRRPRCSRSRRRSSSATSCARTARSTPAGGGAPRTRCRTRSSTRRRSSPTSPRSSGSAQSLLWRARCAMPDWRLFFCVLSTPDRVQHMFWRDRDPAHPRHDPAAITRRGDPIRDAYRRIDALIGEDPEGDASQPGDLLLVVSDHGFAPFRFSVNLNRFLAEEGFLVGTGDRTERTLETSLGGRLAVPRHRLDEDARLLDGAREDLREPGGRAGRDRAEAERREPPRRHPQRGSSRSGTRAGRSSGRRRFARTSTGAPHVDDSADLIIGFERGFRVSWQCTLGSLDEPVIAPNRNLWSGDHCSVDPDARPGRPLLVAAASTRTGRASPTSVRRSRPRSACSRRRTRTDGRSGSDDPERDPPAGRPRPDRARRLPRAR